MTTSGVVADSNNKPLLGIQVTVMQNGTGQILAPGLTDTTDAGGNFSIDNVPDGADAFLKIVDPSGTYIELDQSLVESEGTLNLDKAIKSITDVPVWVWVLVGVVVLYLGYVGYKQGFFKKLFK